MGLFDRFKRRVQEVAEEVDSEELTATEDSDEGQVALQTATEVEEDWDDEPLTELEETPVEPTEPEDEWEDWDDEEEEIEIVRKRKPKPKKKRRVIEYYSSDEELQQDYKPRHHEHQPHHQQHYQQHYQQPRESQQHYQPPQDLNSYL